MYKQISLTISLFLCLAASPQLPTLHWAKSFVAHLYSASVYSNGRSIAVDQLGNVYSAGLFNYTTDFDPGPGLFTLTAGNWANTAIYISKLSPTGDFLWAIQIPTYVDFGNIEIRVDRDNNVYVASELRLLTDFDPGPGVYALSPTGGVDAFVAKYDTNGNFIWAKQFGGPGDTVPRSDVLDIDSSNNVIVCGNFNRTVDFDPGPGVFIITSSAHIQSFIVKLRSTGEFVWAKQFGNSPDVYSGSNIADVKCDLQGNIYTVGNFKGNCDFDPGPANYLLVGQSLRDGYVAKLDSNGNFKWAKRIGNSSGGYYDYAESRGIDLDANNNVYTVGNFTGPFDFDPGPNIHGAVGDNGDWYVLKLNSDGDFIWVDAFGGNQQDLGADVAVGNDGNVYAIGTIGHTADMDPGPGIYSITTVDQYGASALVKVNSNGSFICATPFESIGTAYGSSLTRRMVVDTLQNIYITGAIGGVIDFDPGPNSYPLSSGNTEAPFVLKLGRCLNVTTSTLNINACSSFILNNETFDSTGTYIRTVPNSGGCDSVITLHLTINKKFTQQTKNICTGESFFAGGSNQTTSGTYYDTLQSVSGCDSIITTHLLVNPSPSPDLGPDQDLCKNAQVILSPGTYSGYLWQNGSNASTLTVQDTGLYWVTVVNSFHCPATDSIRINSLFDPPSNFLKTIDSMCVYKGLQIASTNSYPTYLWSTGATEKSIIVTTPGVYWLKAVNTNGCSATDTITVYPKQCMYGVYVPSGFTPNGDGKNDVFRPMIFGNMKQYRFTVYNRWGAIVFQTTDPQKGWDGRVAGSLQPNASFVWTCDYELEGMVSKTEKGTVTLIR